jgi:histidine triad (HIT) family protein
VDGEIPNYLIYEDESALAFLDINPISKGHSLVLPKVHKTKVSELEDDDLKGMFLALKKVIEGIENSIKPEGLNVFINQGAVAGQLVPHLHIHVVPRRENDGIKFEVPSVKLTDGDFKEIANNIKEGIKV